jgi:3-dehydroquinate synthase
VTLKHTSYPIWLGNGLWNVLPDLLNKRGVTPDRKLMLITDERVAPLYGNRVKRVLEEAGFRVGLSVVPAGEKSKNLREWERLLGDCFQFGLDRKSVILALGGGVVGDLAGFVAATYMRGIAFVQLPTTLLAHDSSVGGKVGVNHAYGKNSIGAFHQPLFVAFDVEALRTLPERELRSGMAEVVKHALIRDEAFVNWLERHSAEIIRLEPETVTEMLARSCAVKAEIVSRDEREAGLRALLNYGHTIGHALEAVSGYGTWAHGEAVAVGMAGAARLSTVVLESQPDLVERTEGLLRRFGLPLSIPANITVEELVAAMRRDKKAHGGQIAFVLSRRVGEAELVRGISEEAVRAVLKELGAG